MRASDARSEILRRVSPGNQLLTLAKAYLLKIKVSENRFRPKEMVRGFADSQGFPGVEKFLIDGPDQNSQLNQVVGNISCQIAFFQALWQLIGVGVLMPIGQFLRMSSPRIRESKHRFWMEIR